MDISLREAQETIFNIIQGEEQRSLLCIKELCHCRFYDLPPVPEFHKPSVGMIRSDDLGRLVQFSGTVIRTGMVWLIVGVNCRSRCWKLRKNTNVRILAVAVDSKWRRILNKVVSWRFLYPSIRMCVALDALSIEPKRGQVQICAIQTDRSACFQSTFIQGSVVCCDYEEILVQERIQMLEVGTMPRSITIILLNDLVDCCKVRSLRYWMKNRREMISWSRESCDSAGSRWHAIRNARCLWL